jgi:hypothetical protein
MSVSVKKRKYISCFNADIPEIVTPKRSYTTGYDSEVRIECIITYLIKIILTMNVPDKDYFDYERTS